MDALFKVETLADFIGLAAFMLAFGGVATTMFFTWIGQRDAEWSLDNPPEPEQAPRYPVNPSNAADLLAEMQELRTPLRDHRNPTQPAASTWSGDWEEMR